MKPSRKHVKAWLLAVAITSSLSSGCGTTTEFIQTPVNLPPPKVVPTISASEFRCVVEEPGVGGWVPEVMPAEGDPVCALMVITEVTYGKLVERETIRKAENAGLREQVEAHNQSAVDR